MYKLQLLMKWDGWVGVRLWSLLSIYLSINIYLSACLSIFLSIYMPVYLSVRVSIHLSIHTVSLINIVVSFLDSNWNSYCNLFECNRLVWWCMGSSCHYIVAWHTLSASNNYSCLTHIGCRTVTMAAPLVVVLTSH